MIDSSLLEEMAEMFTQQHGETKIYYHAGEQEFYFLLDDEVNDIYDPEFAEEIRSAPEAYLPLPEITDDFRYEAMSEFVYRLPVGRARRMMEDAMDDVSSFERFDEYVTGLGLEDRWNHFFFERCVEYIEEVMV